MRIHARQRGNAVALFVVLAIGCSQDRIAEPIQRASPAARPQFDKHGNWGQRGRLVTATLVRTIDHSAVADAVRAAAGQSLPNTAIWAASKAALQQSAVEAFTAYYDVQQWSISYTTEDVDGRLVTVSAGVYVPVVDVGTALPLLSVAHGTVTDKQNVPSNSGIIAQGLGHAAHGSAVVFADYLGMGVDATDTPRYLIADVGAETSLDALRATRALLKSQGIRLDGRLFISGYSQGGQVAMALARMIESDPRSGFRVTAAAPASGPYDLYRTAQISLADSTRPYLPRSVYTVYAVAAYNAVFHLAGGLDELLTPSAAAVGERLLATGMTQAQIAPPGGTPLLPTIAAHVLQPAVLEGLLNDPDYPLSRALRDNQTYDWVPTAPLRMYYGDADLDVAPVNASFTAEHMHALGASMTDVMAVELLGPNHELLNHGTALWISIVATRQWFDMFPAPDAPPTDPDDAGPLQN